MHVIPQLVSSFFNSIQFFFSSSFLFQWSKYLSTRKKRKEKISFQDSQWICLRTKKKNDGNKNIIKWISGTSHLSISTHGWWGRGEGRKRDFMALRMKWWNILVSMEMLIWVTNERKKKKGADCEEQNNFVCINFMGFAKGSELPLKRAYSYQADFFLSSGKKRIFHIKRI